MVEHVPGCVDGPRFCSSVHALMGIGLLWRLARRTRWLRAWTCTFLCAQRFSFLAGVYLGLISWIVLTRTELSLLENCRTISPELLHRFLSSPVSCFLPQFPLPADGDGATRGGAQPSPDLEAVPVPCSDLISRERTSLGLGACGMLDSRARVPVSWTGSAGLRIRVILFWVSGTEGSIPCLGLPEVRSRLVAQEAEVCLLGLVAVPWHLLQVSRLLAWWSSVELERRLTLTGHLLRVVGLGGGVNVPFLDEAQRGQCLAQGHTARDEAGKCAEPVRVQATSSAQVCSLGTAWPEWSEVHPLQGPLCATWESQSSGPGGSVVTGLPLWVSSSPAVSPRSLGRGRGHLAQGQRCVLCDLPGMDA